MNIPALEKIALSVRSLSMDAIQKANSGHPGLPLGAAELGAWLYGEGMKYDPADPSWLNRDRFVLSAGHGSMLLYSLLHLAGFKVSIDDIKSFRQIGSICAGHPEYGVTPGVDTTTGPLGQGIANAVGMAIAERMLAARLNTPARKIVDHYTYAFVGDGCLMEGVASEACSLAGHLGLGKLIAYYDSNAITIDGSTSLAFTEDVGKRFEAYGWQVLHGDMYDFAGIARLTEAARADTARPSLVILKSVIGKGSPSKQGTAGVHGSPLGDEEIAKTRAALGLPPGESFHVEPEAYSYFASRRAALASGRAAWDADLAAWKKENPALAAEFDNWMAGKACAALDLPSFAKGEQVATRNASGKSLAAVAKAWPNLVGGSADLTGPNVTQLPASGTAPVAFSAANPAGRMINYGVREFGMAAVANGIALHGGLRTFVATFMVFSDYLRPALRLSALMKLPVVYVLTHDSIFLGEDGPTHQPVEHLAALRSIPGLAVLRPADAEETAVAWRLAMEKSDGPTAIVLSRQNLPVFEKDDPEWPWSMGLGAYVAKNTPTRPDVTVLATGSEVSMALKAVELVAQRKPGLAVSVVSVPDREAFYAAPAPVRDAILAPPARVVAVEAGIARGWERCACPEDILSIDRFGESGPGNAVAKHFGFTAEALADIIARE